MAPRPNKILRILANNAQEVQDSVDVPICKARRVTVLDNSCNKLTNKKPAQGCACTRQCFILSYNLHFSLPKAVPLEGKASIWLCLYKAVPAQGNINISSHVSICSNIVAQT